MAILAYHPFKGLYALAAIGFELARLPLFIVKYLTSYGRQHPEWSFRQALGVRLFFSFVYHAGTVQLPTPLPLTPGKEKERWVTFKPAKDELYKGPLRSNPDVNPAEIGGTWYPAPLTQGSDKSNIRVILHVHGGAFVIADGRTANSGSFAKRLLQHATATHVFCPQYRLSTLPASKTSNAFPAAIQDSLSAYLFLINDLKISPKDIVLSGDSAGGNAIIALLRYLEEYGAELGIPNPAAALLWSPWIDPSDMSGSYTHDNPNYNTDYLNTPLTHWGTLAYAGLPGVKAIQQPYVNTKLKPFKAGVPLWVNACGAEMLCDQIVEWYEKAKEVGNDVELHVEKIAPHDILLIADDMGFQKEGDNSATKAGEWLRSKIGE
ncbi:Alpha/Beta hydrolase protein [Paraphoma chrysanthemicola]|uniref:Alpha/Beta hydrolase protein n=1 Tax=Paraphoma chrysanthemicola TaxID=798071 RepID=A0A8K0VT75_9PLEO|nr:Alpha/Beta hydrolase protein [Paraphoma chrysanthemicola]